jgi:hypothetical protein
MRLKSKPSLAKVSPAIEADGPCRERGFVKYKAFVLGEVLARRKYRGSISLAQDRLRLGGHVYGMDLGLTLPGTAQRDGLMLRGTYEGARS